MNIKELISDNKIFAGVIIIGVFSLFYSYLVFQSSEEDSQKDAMVRYVQDNFLMDFLEHSNAAPQFGGSRNNPEELKKYIQEYGIQISDDGATYIFGKEACQDENRISQFLDPIAYIHAEKEFISGVRQRTKTIRLCLVIVRDKILGLKVINIPFDKDDQTGEKTLIN